LHRSSQEVVEDEARVVGAAGHGNADRRLLPDGVQGGAEELNSSEAPRDGYLTGQALGPVHVDLPEALAQRVGLVGQRGVLEVVGLRLSGGVGAVHARERRPGAGLARAPLNVEAGVAGLGERTPG
jgi:hypothetical protein